MLIRAIQCQLIRGGKHHSYSHDYNECPAEERDGDYDIRYVPFTPFSFLIILILFTVTDFVILMSIAKELDERERVKPLT